jgi:hypothetical protein
MRKLVFAIVAVCIALLPSTRSTLQAEGTVVTFPDPNLEFCVRQAINVPTGGIEQSRLDALTGLACGYYMGISDLSGIEHCTHLQSLSIGWNSVRNIEPLAGLTALQTLHLSGNRISDVTPISGLTGLKWLYLEYNLINDISALAANGGLSAGDLVDLRGNPLNATARTTYIPTLRGRGVDVWFFGYMTVDTATLDLVVGLNFIALPLEPEIPLTASTLAAAIAEDGGVVDQIDTWDYSTGMWSSYKVGLALNDFEIQVGKAYFLKVTTPGSWSMIGYVTDVGLPDYFGVGLNGIGIPYMPTPLTASSLAAYVASLGGEVGQIDMWDESVGMWRSYMPGLPFTDFPLETDRGYFLKVTQSTLGGG